MAPKPIQPNLLCAAYVDHRPTRRRVQCHHQLAPQLDTVWARAHTESHVLHDLGLAVYQGSPQLEARFHNTKHELMRMTTFRDTDALASLISFIELAEEWYTLQGQRKTIAEIVATTWRPATDTDL